MDLRLRSSGRSRRLWFTILLLLFRVSNCQEMNCTDGFLCENGNCVPSSLFCNADDDCGDGSDEIRVDGNGTDANGIACRQYWDGNPLHSPKLCLLPTSQISKSSLLCNIDSHCSEGFVCESGGCIEPLSFCDGDPNCRDGDDELTQLSAGRHLLCSSVNSDTKCSLPDHHVCDGISHCMEGVDECLCAGTQVFLDQKCFRCFSERSHVIPIARLCDGVFDCPDLTDECGCVGKQKPKLCDKVLWGQSRISFSVSCPSNNSVKMLEVEKVCNDKIDCDGEMDETDCGRDSSSANIVAKTSNNSGLYYCESLKRYVRPCDGKIDCRSESHSEECAACPDTKPEFCKTFTNISRCAYPGYESRSFEDLLKEPCDGIARCHLNVDEIGCADRFYCKNGTSKVFHIEWDKVCDKIDDCEDGSDEEPYQNCSFFACNDGGSVKYLDSYQVCDGTFDCAKGSDECQDQCFRSVFSDAKSMIKNGGVEFVAWIISFAAVIGNVAVIAFIVKDVYFSKREGELDSDFSVINKFLILNLSISDLIVGIYTFAVVIQNAMNRGRYCFVDQEWRSSKTCSAIGSLLVVGSQQSVFMMIIITIFRVCSVTTLKFELKTWKMRIIIISTWIISIFLAVIPLMPHLEDTFIDSVWYKDNKLFSHIRNEEVSDLSNWLTLMNDNTDSTGFIRSDGSWATLETLISTLNPNFTVVHKFGFYSSHTVCLPTFFPNRRTDTAWYYSLLLITINFVSFLAVFIGSIVIYRSAAGRTSVNTESMSKDRSSSMQRKLSRIIITDFCCWMPVCIMGFLQLSGVEIPKETYLPVALIVLPINSMLNPFLYSNVPDKIWAKLKRVCSCCSNTEGLENQTDSQRDQVMELRDLQTTHEDLP